MTSSADSAALERLSKTCLSGPIAHLPEWKGIMAGDIEAGVRSLIEQSEAAFVELESSMEPTWAGLMEPLERIEHRLGAVVSPIMHLISVKYSDELQAAYDEVRPAVVQLTSQMSQSRPVYEGMKALQSSPEGAGLSVARARILAESIKAMERSGVHLEGEAKARYQEIDERLAELSNEFQTNLVKQEKGARVKVVDKTKLDGVPEAVVRWRPPGRRRRRSRYQQRRW